ncbi:conserved hypothetical protein [Verrucomicrobia bacterium]|nr:conserved hypothetical protein [Verrucomicrobiota bacterium]
MDRHPAVYFLNEFRQARAAVLQDAEAVDAVIHALERMGMFLYKRVGDLGRYEKFIWDFVERHSKLAKQVPDQCSEHIHFETLYNALQEARNSAMHEGAYARQLASNAVRLALILEDALMNTLEHVEDFMVRNPMCAEMWQPLSFIRQTMLENSFSWLPVCVEAAGQPAWQLVSDTEVALYLRPKPHCKQRADLRGRSLQEATKGHDGIKLNLITAPTLEPKAKVVDVLIKWDSQDGKLGQNTLPVLVTRKGTAELLGILTPHDLL